MGAVVADTTVVWVEGSVSVTVTVVSVTGTVDSVSIACVCEGGLGCSVGSALTDNATNGNSRINRNGTAQSVLHITHPPF